ncbi:MAG: hypothetical protein EOM20_20965 [Spartobacteria bacterium]|nr:hypothetical protein [Spartobacteria bacterium]
MRMLCLFLGAVLLAGCTTVKRPYVDVQGAAPAERVGISAVPFCEEMAGRPIQTRPDGNMAHLMVAGIEQSLKQKGYAPFFMRQHLELIPGEEQTLIRGKDVLPLINDTSLTQIELPESQKQQREALAAKVPHILVPVYVKAKANPALVVIGRNGTFSVTLHAFLIETATGKVIWKNKASTWGNEDFMTEGMGTGRFIYGLLSGFPSNTGAL